MNVYASFNRGFKSGSYSLQSPLNAPYLPQYIKAYEVGLKSELFDRRLRLNVAAFHYDIDDYQVRSAAVANPGASLILNAATVKVDGAEVEFEVAPIDELRLFGGVTYLDSRFDQFGGPNAAFQAPIVYPNPATCPANLRGTENPGVLSAGARTGGFTTCFGDVSGLDTPNAPQLTASVGASYTLAVGESGEVRVSALYSYNDGYVFEPDNIARQGDYNLLECLARISSDGELRHRVLGPQPHRRGVCRPEDHDRHRYHGRTRRAADLWCERESRLLRSNETFGR